MPVLHAHTAEEFQALLSGGGSFGSAAAVVVDFTASWCGPCQAIAPVFEKLSNEHPTVKFVKVDVDELQEVASKAGVRAMPTFQTYLNGVKVGELTGANPAGLQQLVADLVDKLSRTSGGTGQRLGGGDSAAGSSAPNDLRERMAAAAEARAKAAGA